MIPRKLKAAYYGAMSPFMKLNGLAYRFFRAPRSGNLLVHLGPGQRKYIEGMVNIDANAFSGKCDVWADLTHSLPFNDNTVDAIYSHHVVEHLPNIFNHFCEIRRCLKVGGVYRVAVPNADSAITKFLSNDLAWFGTFPDKRASVGGRLDNFILCRNEHLFILTRSFLVEIIESAGFSKVSRRTPVIDTGYPEFFDRCIETEEESDFDIPHTLVLELVKE